MNAGRPRKLDDTAVREIRAWHQARMALATPGEIRKRFNISGSNLSLITRGLIYKVTANG